MKNQLYFRLQVTLPINMLGVLVFVVFLLGEITTSNKPYIDESEYYLKSLECLYYPHTRASQRSSAKFKQPQDIDALVFHLINTTLPGKGWLIQLTTFQQIDIKNSLLPTILRWPLPVKRINIR